ncbi:MULTISPECIES: hypothetical protein [Nocardiaceae]|uniref:hypothetical protein n=1 Tax=Nocardiaceae TaxID=85025 RepID=UPI0006909EF4|nr:MULTISPECIES: hypothetical protein [Rhodococcus]OZD12020.1 hypothetical protein CH248_28850 [Rhodococcus sp. 06-156-4a]OZD15785.1 hypothetical protein CH253_22730 [Rhodococcus sp. 06-156-3C]OZD21169.1 hypothetical protein CH280_02960 [Rhodococcus sp. 06-156-4C]OZD32351.1 hypothetical protein CH284_20890 [Rhodococcus sp. 06-156-3]OZD36573.1 hypothetical protein CH247_03315 [Rhodococcus sp. 06-156-3b]
MVAFWWASQGKNHPIAIKQGSLWTCPWADGSLPTDRALIKKIQPGDVVFHYQGPFLRAVSVAVASFVPYLRPDGYPKGIDAHPDDGWLVTVDPVIQGLEIHRSRIAELLPHGSPGPLDKNGSPQQKYLSMLSQRDGARLLEEIDLAPLSVSADLPVESAEMYVQDRDTDAAARVWSRIEQRGLRAYLLAGRTEASCGLCGRLLPTALLVAGHIKPRAHCTNQERWNYRAIAMLACLFGCDALFEHGFIAVDDDGTIVEGRATTNKELTRASAELIGSTCPAFDETRAGAFRAHRELSRL